MRVAAEKDYARAEVHVYMVQPLEGDDVQVFVPGGGVTPNPGFYLPEKFGPGVNIPPSLVLREDLALRVYRELHKMYGKDEPSRDRLRGQEFAFEIQAEHLKDMRKLVFGAYESQD